MSANSYGSVLTSDGYKCLSEAEELALKETCSKSDESSLVCDSASGWYFDSGRLRRAECDLAIENKRLELAFGAVRKAVEKLDQDEVSEDGGYPAGHPIKMILDDAQEAWLAYVSLHCKELAGPRGAGLAWHADET